MPDIDYYNMEDLPNYLPPYQQDFYFRHMSLKPCRAINVEDYKYWCTIGGEANDRTSGPRDELTIKKELYIGNYLVYNLDKVGAKVSGSQFSTPELGPLEQPFYSYKRYKVEEVDDGSGNTILQPIGSEYFQVRRHVPSERKCNSLLDPRLFADIKGTTGFFNNLFIFSELELVAFYKGGKLLGYGMSGSDSGSSAPSGGGGGIGAFMMSGYVGSGFYSQIWTGGYTNNSVAYPDKYIPNPEATFPPQPDILVPDYTKPKGEVSNGIFTLSTPFGPAQMVSTIFIQTDTEAGSGNPDTEWEWSIDGSSIQTTTSLYGVEYSLELKNNRFTFYKMMGIQGLPLLDD